MEKLKPVANKANIVITTICFVVSSGFCVYLYNKFSDLANAQIFPTAALRKEKSLHGVSNNNNNKLSSLVKHSKKVSGGSRRNCKVLKERRIHWYSLFSFQKQTLPDLYRKIKSLPSQRRKSLIGKLLSTRKPRTLPGIGSPNSSPNKTCPLPISLLFVLFFFW